MKSSTATTTISSDDWDSFVSDTTIPTAVVANHIKTTDDARMTPSKDDNNSNTTAAAAAAASPWEDASYTLITTSSSSTPPRTTTTTTNTSRQHDPQHRPYFGRFTQRGNTSNSSCHPRENNDDGTSSSTPNHTSTVWTREYNLSHALHYTERMTLQLRYIVLYVTSVLDMMYAIFITIYIMCIFYHLHYYYTHKTKENDDTNDPSTFRMTHSNYRITTILMCGLWIHTIFLYIRCGIIFTTTKNHHSSTECRLLLLLWLSRSVTIGLILWYMICCIPLLVTWNILHLPALQHFLLVFPHDDDNNDDSHTQKYNIQSYWLFRPSLIRYIQNHHCMNYLYLLVLLFGIIEMIRFVILQSYFSAILLLHHNQDNNDNHMHMRDDEYHMIEEESLLPSRFLWYENDENSPIVTSSSTTTTTSWRTTTLNHDSFMGWKWRNNKSTNTTSTPPQSSLTTNTTLTTNRRNDHQILDPLQFQTIQEEWNYRKEIHGPYWWSQE